jgi:hypothetical protein
MSPKELASVAEIAALRGVSKKRVVRYAWRIAEIEQWLAEHRKPTRGRPRRTIDG